MNRILLLSLLGLSLVTLGQVIKIDTIANFGKNSNLRNVSINSQDELLVYDPNVNMAAVKTGHLIDSTGAMIRSYQFSNVFQISLDPSGNGATVYMASGFYHINDIYGYMDGGDSIEIKALDQLMNPNYVELSFGGPYFYTDIHANIYTKYFGYGRGDNRHIFRKINNKFLFTKELVQEDSAPQFYCYDRFHDRNLFLKDNTLWALDSNFSFVTPQIFHNSTKGTAYKLKDHFVLRHNDTLSLLNLQGQMLSHVTLPGYYSNSSGVVDSKGNLFLSNGISVYKVSIKEIVTKAHDDASNSDMLWQRTTEGILINCEDFERVELHDVLGRHEIRYEHRVSTNLKGLWYVRVFNKAGMAYFFKVVL